MEEKLPQRKPTHLGYFDYATAGAYFITICAENKNYIFGDFEKKLILNKDHTDIMNIVGDGVYDIPQNSTKLRMMIAIMATQLFLTFISTTIIENLLVLHTFVEVRLATTRMNIRKALPKKTMQEVFLK